MQDRQHDFERRGLRLRVLFDRDAAAVVLHRDRAAVFVQRHVDAVAFAGQMFVDRVIDDLPNQVMQPARIDTPDVHRRPPPHGFQPFEDFDVVAGVV